MHDVGLLVLVRHGQASLFTDNYDRLSELGEQQARLLGQHWARTGVAFDEVITGPRQRQIDTARIAALECELPAPRVVPEFDELHAEELLRKKLPELTMEHASLRARVADLSATADRAGQLKGFQRVFEAVMGMWIRGEIDAPDIESWQRFCARVAAGIGDLRESDQRGRRVAAFTSAGTIAAAMKCALDLTDEKMLNLAGVVHNASITELAFTRTRLTPMTFNSLPHILDRALVTSR